jgi:hypothetical protein
MGMKKVWVKERMGMEGGRSCGTEPDPCLHREEDLPVSYNPIA